MRHKFYLAICVTLIILSIVSSTLLESENKEKDLPIHSNTLLFDNTCDDVWSAAVSSLTAIQMIILNTDRTGGIISFTAKGSGKGIKLVANPGKGKWSAYKIHSGTASIVPTENQCKCAIKIAYLRLKGSFDPEWVPIPSNNSTEHKLLVGMSKKLLTKGTDKK